MVGEIKREDLTVESVCKLAPSEIILTNENMDYAFFSVYDSFITLFLSREKKIEEIINEQNWEAVICEQDTYMSWYYGKI